MFQLVLILTLSFVHAASDFNVNEFTSKYGCFQPNTKADSSVCGYQTTALCREFSGANGCPKGGSDLKDPAQYWKGATDQTVPAKLQTALADTKNLYNRATVCCGDGSNCDLAKAIVQTAPARAQQAEGAKDSLKGDAVASAGTNQEYGETSAATAGACRARRDICVYQADRAVKKLDEALPGASCGDNCNAAKTSLNSVKSDCQSQSEQIALQNANQGFDNQKQAESSKEDASSDGKGTKENSATPQSKAADSSGGGLGQMMGPLMQAMAATQQQQPTDPSAAAAAAAQAPDCSNPNIVDPYGRCPAAGVAATNDSWNALNGSQAGLQAQSAGGSFNVGSTPPGLNGNGFIPTSVGAAQQPLASGGVPQGGGGIPGSGGVSGGVGPGGSVGATLAAAMSGKADILHGERSGGGGGSSGAVGSAGGGGSSGGGWSGYGHGEEPNFSLADFLPGHAKDPKRGLAGGNARNIQIQSKEVNIWARISDHIRARCSQGLLRDCVP